MLLLRAFISISNAFFLGVVVAGVVFSGVVDLTVLTFWTVGDFGAVVRRLAELVFSLYEPRDVDLDRRRVRDVAPGGRERWTRIESDYADKTFKMCGVRINAYENM